MAYIDLTQSFNSTMPVYPGDLPAELKQTTSFEKEGLVHFDVKTGMHVGTHMDAPLHMIPAGKKLSEYPVEKFFGRGVLIDVRGQTSIDSGVLSGREVKKGDIVLVMFGWSEKFTHPDYFEKQPVMTEDFAKKLRELGVSIVGMDTPSPDKEPFKVHKILLAHDILIIENLTNLAALINKENFEIIAMPAKFQTEAAPCRVVAKIN